MKGMKAKARKKVLEKLRKEMKDEKHEGSGIKDAMKKMKDMQKVTVASDSPEGLMKGMDVAKKIMKKKMESEDGEDYKCGGAKYADGGTKEKGVMTDKDIERMSKAEKIMKKKKKKY